MSGATPIVLPPDITPSADQLATIQAKCAALEAANPVPDVALDGVADFTAVDLLHVDSTAAQVESALLRFRESIASDLDPMSREQLRLELRRRLDARQVRNVNAKMIAVTVAAPPKSRQTDDGGGRGPSAATRLLEIVEDAGIELWSSPAGDAFVSFRSDGHVEHWRLRSAFFREYLSRLYHIETGAVANGNALSDALGVLGALSRSTDERHEPAVRVGGHAGDVYLDLGRPDWSVIRITSNGWHLVHESPVRFIRPSGMLGLPVPVPGGRVDALRALLDLTDDDYRLLVGFLVGALRPTGPYPMLALVGEQGSGKSTAARIIRRLIDPAIAELRADPKSIDDLMISARNSRIAAFDNLSHIPPWLSDGLCRLATGGALTKRMLFTDGDEILIEAMRPTMLTSITDVITRGDLLDRALVVQLPVLATRRTEADLWRRFDAAAPRLLGALLDGVVSALRLEDQTTISDLPRLADWCTWSQAAEPGLGWPSGGILAAYVTMRSRVTEQSLDGDPLAIALRRLALPWTGTAADLLNAVAGSGRNPRGWPETPRAMAAALRRMAPNLRRVGVEVAYMREAHTGRRLIALDGTPAEPSPSPPASPRPSLLGESGDATGDGRTLASSPNPPSVYAGGCDGDYGDANSGALPEDIADGLF